MHATVVLKMPCRVADYITRSRAWRDHKPIKSLVSNKSYTDRTTLLFPTIVTHWDSGRGRFLHICMSVKYEENVRMVCAARTSRASDTMVSPTV